MTKHLILLAALLAAPAAQAGIISVPASAFAQEALQAALIDAKPGDIIQLGEGRYDLTIGLSLDVNDVTVQGAGADKTILSFKNQKGAGEGLLVTSDNVLLRDFAVEDSKGDGIKSKGADNIIYHRLRVEWTGGPLTTNGAYGLYPVESSNVLIDGVTVKGASDAGIYVGQSRNIIVRNSVAQFNVAGIEIENSYNADVYQNTATRNTGGILVFDLPNLPQMGGHDVRIFANNASDNDTPNFAPKGNIVASVPVGTGIMVMANRNVAVYGNVLKNNQTANVMLTAYPNAYKDKKYNPLPRNVVVRDNFHGRSGWAPAIVPEGEQRTMLGQLATAILWDGNQSRKQPLRVLDKVPLLSLGMKKAGQGVENAAPKPADLSRARRFAEPVEVVLPFAMEAKIGAAGGE